MLSENSNFDERLFEQLKEYEHITFEELKLIDILVAGCYATMQHFQLFNAWSMLYFTFTILYEQRRLKNQPVKYFLEADNQEVQKIVQTTYKDLLKLTAQRTISAKDADQFTSMVRERIKPFNTAGLLEPLSKNMYYHTVAAL
jgi:FADH2 O2-dependent halogenase